MRDVVRDESDSLVGFILRTTLMPEKVTEAEYSGGIEWEFVDC